MMPFAQSPKYFSNSFDNSPNASLVDLRGQLKWRKPFIPEQGNSSHTFKNWTKKDIASPG